MGISRDRAHKHRATGGKRVQIRKKRKFELGRPAANTKLSQGTPARVRTVRTRGGNIKFRALRLDHGKLFFNDWQQFLSLEKKETNHRVHREKKCILINGCFWGIFPSGNFSWGSERCTRKARIIDVIYNASNNELVRTKTLVKNAIVLVDAAPFRLWYENHYAVPLGRKHGTKIGDIDGLKLGKKRLETDAQKALMEKAPVDPLMEEQFATGRLKACVSSRPGQCGRCDGYILEGKELEFYSRKVRALLSLSFFMIEKQFFLFLTSRASNNRSVFRTIGTRWTGESQFCSSELLIFLRQW